MKLRNYQQAAVEAVFESWKSNRSVLVSMATGLGKTVVLSAIIQRLLRESPGRRAMVLAHRSELIEQGQATIHRLTGADVQMEMADCRVVPMFGREPEVVVSTIQTQTAGEDGHERMRRFDPAGFGCVIVDECHHAVSQSYRDCLGWYRQNPDLRVLGLTATPDRGDAVALGHVFDAVAYEYTIADAIDDGWLVPVRQRFVKVESLDFSSVSVNAGDFNQAELAEVLEDERNLHGIAAPLLEIAGSRPTVVFAASVKQAERLAEILNRGGAGRAEWVCGKTDRDKRRQIVDDYRAGRIQFLVNVACFTEGFDAANTAVVAIAQPTKARARYAQEVGRGLRPSPETADRLGELATPEERKALIAASAKPSCLVVDFVGNAGRHKLVSCGDILGGKDLPEGAAERTRRIVEDAGGEMDASEAVRRAAAEIEREKAAAAKRRAFIQATAKYVSTSVDPFDLADIPVVDGAQAMARSPLDVRRLSAKQRDILRNRLKVNPDAHTYEECRALLDDSFRRYSLGLASLMQMKYLRKHGIPVPMDRDEAKRTLDRLFRRGA